MKQLFLLVNISIFIISFGQKKVYYNCNFSNKDKRGCNYTITKWMKDTNSVEYYNCLQKLVKIESFFDEKRHGYWALFNYDGSLFSSGYYRFGIFDSTWIRFSRDGSKHICQYSMGKMLLSADLGVNGDTLYLHKYYPGNITKYQTYNDGQLASILIRNTLGKDSIKTVLIEKKDESNLSKDSVSIQQSTDKDSITIITNNPEKPPHFSGGPDAFNKFVEETLVYPREAAIYNICGTVRIYFVVRTDGTVDRVRIDSSKPSMHPLLEQEAIRIINKSSGKWSPGEQNGKKVKVLCVVPIEFSIE